MKIAICGSLQFYKEMLQVQKQLQALGHKAIVPKSLRLITHHGFTKPKTVSQRLKAEAEHDFIREHFRIIEKADVVLVVNETKHGVKGYIGGNTFLEMGIAFYLGKKIYLLYDIPKMEYALELHAMRPVVLRGDFRRL